MKDCKWNPPTAGSKGLHFTGDGKLLSRAELADLEPGTKVYKFLDESGDRTTRRKAQRQIELMLKADTLQADLPLEYRTAWPGGGNWVVHTRSEDDKLSAEANLALALGIPRLKATNIFFRSGDFLRHAELTSPENAAATAELINLHRNGLLTKELLGAFPNHSTAPPVPGLLSREEALANYLSRETAITDFLKALPIARSFTLDRRAQVTFALNAAHHAEALDRLPEELRATAAELFIGYGLNAATLDGVKVLGRPEDILRTLTNLPGSGITKGLTVTRLAEVSQMLSQTGLSAHFASSRFGEALGEYWLPEVLQYSRTLDGKRALSLAITAASVLSDADAPGAISSLAASARNSNLVENPLASELCQVQAALTFALEKGRLTAHSSSATVRAYLDDPADAAFKTPRIAFSLENNPSLGRGAEFTPPGFISMSAIYPRNMQRPSVSERVDYVSAHNGVQYDGVSLPAYVVPVDVATVASLALARNQGGSLTSEQRRRADELITHGSLAEIARHALDEIKVASDGSVGVPDMLRAGLAIKEACTSGNVPPQALVTALTEVLDSGSFSYEKDEPANLSAIKQLAAIRSGSKPETWQVKATRLAVADHQTLHDALEADGLLAQLRTEVLAEPAVAYLRTSRPERGGPIMETSVVIALAPSTDPAKVTALLEQHFPLTEGAIQVRNEEIVVSVNTLASPFSAVSQIEETLAAL